MTSQEAFLKGGTSYPAIKPEKIGESIIGTIIGTPEPIQRPNLNDPTKLDWQLPVNLDVKGEKRTFWVPKSQLSAAINEACVEAGAPGLAEGGKLKVELIEQRPTKFPKPQNIYKATYRPPAAPVVTEADIFDGAGADDAGGDDAF